MPILSISVFQDSLTLSPGVGMEPREPLSFRGRSLEGEPVPWQTREMPDSRHNLGMGGDSGATVGPCRLLIGRELDVGATS